MSTTSEDVRHDYVWMRTGRPGVRDAGIDFDKWLAEHDRVVAAAAWLEGYASRPCMRRTGWQIRRSETRMRTR